MRNYRHLLILSFLTLVFGCTRELQETIECHYGEPIPFSVSVDTGPLTRASFNGSSISSGDYKFAAGDKLYISDPEGNISGVLDITSGIGSGTATFNGDLTPVANFTPTADTDLNITLVGSSQSSFFPMTGERITGAPNYPSTIPASTSVADLVQNYSHFTANVKYGVRSYTLNQQTVFLNFRIDLLASSLSNSPSSVNVEVKSADGNTTLRTVSGVTVGGNASISCLQFTTIFPAGTSLQGAQIIVANGDGIHCTPDFASDLTLEANKYYAVARTNVEPFTVEAPSGGTGATITLKFENLQYRRYTGGAWTDWDDCPASITITAGDKINLRGKGTSYENNDSSHPIFTTNNPVNIFGDIMSLMCDEDWDRKSAIGNKAFYQAFKGVSVNIPDGKELLLSAVTLGTSCYEGMFSGCTSLKKTPVLPATTSATSCYKAMFYGCTNLTSAPASIPIATVENSAFHQMFFNCSKLVTAPALPSITIVKEYGCKEMFSGCSKLTTPPPSLPATTLNKQAYYQMFYKCSALTSIPSFPCDPDATNYSLFSGTADKDGVCYQMFFQCNALKTIPQGKKLFNSQTALGKYCFQDMFSECKYLASVPSDFLPATTLAVSCYRGMFQSTAITSAPDLLAETLVQDCYRYMFNKCTKLEYIKCYSSTSVTADTYTQNWLTNAKNTSDCKFHFRSGVTWQRENTYGIPTNWDAIADTVQ